MKKKGTEHIQMGIDNSDPADLKLASSFLNVNALTSSATDRAETVRAYQIQLMQLKHCLITVL